MKVTTWLIIILLSIIALLPLTVSKSIASPAPIVIVLGEDSYPFQFLNEKGEPAGLLVDLWKEWSRQVHKPVVFVARHWQDSLNQLEKGNATIHMGMARTKPRLAKFGFAAAISGVNTHLYLHKELVDKRNFSDLVPYHIGVVTGSSHEAILTKSEPRLSFKYFETRESLFKAIAAGEIKVFAGMEGYIRDQTKQKVLSEQFPSNHRMLITRTLLYPAVVKGDQQSLDLIKQGFDKIGSEFTEHVERRWLGYRSEQSGISIAMQLGVEPFIDIGIDGLPHGLLVDMWKLWSDKTGIDINFIPGSMDESLQYVRTGFADVHIGYPESEKLKSGLERAWHLYTIKSRLFSYQSTVSDLEDLSNERIGVFPTSPYLADLKEALPNSQLRFYDSMDAMVQSAKRGDITAFVAAGAWTQHYLLAHQTWGEFSQYDGLEFQTEMYALVRNEEQGLVKRIRSGFNLISYPEFAKVEQKWMLNINDHIFTQDDQQLVLDSEQLDYLRDLKTLTLGYLEEAAPMEFTNEDGLLGGVNGDIVKILERSLNIKVKTKAYKQWNDLVLALKDKQVDFAGSMAVTSMLTNNVNYSASYWSSPWAVVSKREELSVFYLNQITSKRLAVVEGSQVLSELMSQSPSLKIILVPNAAAGLEAVYKGNADLFIDNIMALQRVLTVNNYNQLSLSILSDFSDRSSYFVMGKQHAQLVPLFNMVLQHLSKVDKQQMTSKWLDNAEARHNESDYGMLLIIMFSVLIVMLTLILITKQKRDPNGGRIMLLGGKKPTNQNPAVAHLPNKAVLNDRLQHAALLAQREQSHFAVMFIRLEGMEKLSDKKLAKYSSNLVDELINIQHQSIRKSDTLARYSNTEFVMVLNHIHNKESACQIAEKLVQQINVPFDLVGRPIVINPCIGIAVYPADSDNALELLKLAGDLSTQVQQHAGMGYQIN